MAFDGLFIHGLTQALSQALTGGRIDKIHQPENDEIQLSIRSNNQNYKLKITADPSLPYITLWDDKKENPMQPPLFCMLLRKHLASGKIQEVRQMGLERVIELDIESRDELGNLSVKTLAVEIMGKHSNIILYQKEDRRILESIKRISASMSRIRQVYPGIPYTPPPFDKLDLLTMPLIATDELPDLSADITLPKWLVKHFQGFSPSSAHIFLIKWNLSEDLKINDLAPFEVKQLLHGLSELKRLLTNGGFQYGVAYENPTHKMPQDIFAFTPVGTSNDLNIKTFDSALDTVNAFFSGRDTGNRLDQKSSFMKKAVQARLDKALAKLGNLQEDFQNAERADEHKIKGELILANLYQMEKGLSKIVLDNYYTDPPESMEIPLDIRLMPVDNAQRYFKKYNKAKNGQIEILKQLEETQTEVEYLENVMNLIEQTTDADNLDEIRNELASQGYVKRKSTINKQKKKISSPLKFISSEGFEILVGKNNLQNDQLTLKIASNKDLWLHTKIIPGSHVIVRTQGQEVPDTTLQEAAMIAAWHSKGRSSGQVPVDYTLVKNVSKPAGAKPGMVIYNTNKTLYVTPNETLIQKLTAK